MIGCLIPQGRRTGCPSPVGGLFPAPALAYRLGSGISVDIQYKSDIRHLHQIFIVV